MCGIAGIFAYRDTAPPVDREELLRIREAMRVRGPDGAGLWVSDDGRVGLAHRRLAIIDLSADGAQPMATPDGRLCITFNGEIYNYRELRRELEAKGYRFRSQSDTEVLLHLYADRGPEMVHALRGMYAFGIWDAREQSLFLARDPFGIKPLYYADDGQTLRFASQVKALLKGGAVDTAPEPAGSVGFLILGAVPEPFTLYRGVRALPAGAHLTVRRDGEPALGTHFSIRDELARAQECPPPARARHEVLAEALRDTVRHHLVSDVPVGVFLSSGLDSALVTALASEETVGPLQAITLGFDEYRGTANDEVPLAQTVAARYGARHEASFVSREDFESELENILANMDQPSIDGVNTYFVSRAAARSGLKVALSGLGGDELFGGYPSFRHVPRLAEWLRFVRLLPMLGRAARFLSAPLLRSVTSPKLCRAPRVWRQLRRRVSSAARAIHALGARRDSRPGHGREPVWRNWTCRLALRRRFRACASRGRESRHSSFPGTCAINCCATRTGPAWRIRWRSACRSWMSVCSRRWRRSWWAQSRRASSMLSPH